MKSPKSSRKNSQAQYEASMQRYLPLVGGTVWATYDVLLSFRNRKRNQAFPAYQTIATRRGLSRRTVIRHVNVLVAVGLIEKMEWYLAKGGQSSNRYWFTAYRPGDVTPSVPKSKPITSSFSDRYKPPDCDHPWGDPLGYPYEGFYRCSSCGDLYKRGRTG